MNRIESVGVLLRSPSCPAVTDAGCTAHAAVRLSSERTSILGAVRCDERVQVLGPAEAPVPRLKNEYRYQFLIKAASRKALNELLQRIRTFALERKWGATALVIDVDPLSLM